MKYRPNDDEAAVAAVVARRRNSLNGGQSNIPGGETATEEERFRQHYAACLSEIAISRMANLCWTGCGRGAGGVPDVGGIWQVRCISERHKGLLVRGKDAQDEPIVLVYVDTQTRECEALGWATASIVIGTGRGHDLDSDRPCWTLSPAALFPFPP